MAELTISLLILISASLVIFSSNPVFGVVWLVFTFMHGCLVFWTLGASFLSLILMMVYVGAMAVLFVFVLMILPTSLRPLPSEIMKLLPVVGVMGIVVSVGIYMIMPLFSYTPVAWSWSVASLKSAGPLFFCLYEKSPSILLMAGLVLLAALMGSLILCLSPFKGEVVLSKKQSQFSQLSS